jgi:hypothetical protein
VSAVARDRFADERERQAGDPGDGGDPASKEGHQEPLGRPRPTAEGLGQRSARLSTDFLEPHAGAAGYHKKAVTRRALNGPFRSRPAAPRACVPPRGRRLLSRSRRRGRRQLAHRTRRPRLAVGGGLGGSGRDAHATALKGDDEGSYA